MGSASEWPRKTFRPSKVQLPLFLPVFEADYLLCPVNCLESYLSRTATVRGQCMQVPLTTQTPHQAAFRDTVANWIKRVLNRAGIDTAMFRAHSTRGSSTSKALAAGVPIADILSVADWSSDTTFNRFYCQKPPFRANFGVQVLTQSAKL